jgi:hypothetical protein
MKKLMYRVFYWTTDDHLLDAFFDTKDAAEAFANMWVEKFNKDATVNRFKWEVEVEE